jgi:hypothetical protein
MIHTVYVPGCDDSTVVHVSLTESEAAAVAKVARLVVAEGGGCSPRMFVDRGVHDYLNETPGDL